MAMMNLFPNFTSLSPTYPTKNLLFFHTSLPLTSHNHFSTQTREFSLLGLASSSITPVTPIIDTEWMERQFSNSGVSFTRIGDNCVVRMALDNGSVASLMLPSGLITSYKPHMWHGSTIELLQTVVSEGEDGGAIVQGGMSVNLTLGSTDGFEWSPTTWVLHNVRGSSSTSIQVELISSDSEDMVQVKWTITLQQDTLISQVVISNGKDTHLKLMGTLMSHITVSSPDATYAVGLAGSDYLTKPPFFTDCSIIPPALSQSQLWGGRGNALDENETVEMEEETDDEVHLTEKMSRIYTSAPSMFDIMDRGKRNSVGLGSDGFEELYIFSPGSNHEMYGKYAYICIGPAAMLKPVILESQGVWTGVQYLHNPNL